MTADIRATDSIGTIFVTALLLTGRVRLAEASIKRGFDWLDDPDSASDEELMSVTILAASDFPDSQNVQEREDSLFLPPELRHVLKLPSDLRRCFVLRVLRAMPRESCARLLGLDAGAVDRNAGLAAQALAAISSDNQKKGRKGKQHDFSRVYFVSRLP